MCIRFYTYSLIIKNRFILSFIILVSLSARSDDIGSQGLPTGYADSIRPNKRLNLL